MDRHHIFHKVTIALENIQFAAIDIYIHTYIHLYIYYTYYSLVLKSLVFAASYLYKLK